MEKYRIGKVQTKHDESGIVANCIRLNIHALFSIKKDLLSIIIWKKSIKM